MMLERIKKLLRELEWNRYVTVVDGKMAATCPSCCHPRYELGSMKGGHASYCHLKACLDDIEAALAKAEENES